ncbi:MULTISPECIES: tryptophan synthase subunit alpha [unclassified Bacillus (in: firmicutes)]|uniref:tryptophan synthase subunit alpha n=1 Tax=unclassified Bacillus (in: firmicutes) TaxID=185979 RepID=UPI000BEF2CDC|nr:MULTISPECIES: tryptophan synthase subunit alpha [unclassified Bacillus (in: firmicutes)]PEJ58377.1 tryptophan synthase subunit alpha [Bacillus sp. AFS002410]PEL08112.1 tryptophan synthase subunit alpha [Bacillus sp. AFS017336]
MNRIECQFSERIKKGEKLFIPYIMAGDGGLEVLGGRLALLEKFGASAIEIGIPFSDPVADGPVIQQAGIRALQEGTTLKAVLEKIKEVRKLVSVPLIVMTYMNPILAYGIDKFVADLKQAGVDGCIIPDLPIEEEEIIINKLEEFEVELIRLVTMTTPKERIIKIAEKGKGFLYTVTVKGITGVRNELDVSLSSFLKGVKEVSNKPVIAGFGVSSPDQVKELCQDCDGVIVGSKIVDLFNQNKINEIKLLMESILVSEEVI